MQLKQYTPIPGKNKNTLDNCGVYKDDESILEE